MSGDTPSIAVVGTGSARASALSTLDSGDHTVREITPMEVPGEAPTLWICTTPDALRAVVLNSPAAPVMVTDSVVPTGVTSGSIQELIADWKADGVVTHSLPFYSVNVGERQLPMLREVVISTDAVAQISEFAVTHHNRSLQEVRADGIVVAGPVGSGGYAQSLGGPRVGAVDGLIAVPMAGFASHTPTWVTPAPVTVSVVREEAVVSAHIDGTETVQLDPGASLLITQAGRYDVIGQW